MKKGEKMSDEMKEKIRQSNLGKKHTISETGLTRMKVKNYEPWNKGKVGVMPTPWNKGTKGKMGKHWNQGNSKLVEKKCKICENTFKHRTKVYCSSDCYHKSQRGDGNCNWINDRRLVKLDKERGGPRHKQWSKDVKNRDSWKCRLYDNTCYGKVVAHHIYSWRDYIAKRYEVSNGITLCMKHHPRTREDENQDRGQRSGGSIQLI